VRLTLRTLLAYLDDTLEPAQAKLIGQKVAESDTAQELIARIREVTRRRRITTPSATGPGAKVDPNTVAEYLDNVLDSDKLAEVEQLALASDVHLAEIAACHQILTLVMGEPATVPPLAYKRMYELVKPPESNPNHRPPVRREQEELPAENREVDETLRLGLPILRTSNWNNRLILLGGVAAALILLGIAIWQLLPSFHTFEPGGDGGQVQATPGRPTTSEAKGKKDGGAGKDKKGGQPKGEPGPGDDGKGRAFVRRDRKGVEEPIVEAKIRAPERRPGVPAVVPVEEPTAIDPAVREVGSFEPPAAGSQSVLLQFLAEGKARPHWVRLGRQKDLPRIKTNAPLLSLPGYRSTVALDSKLRLTLWGNLPELSFLPFAQESLVVLHPTKLGLDVTIKRGRIAVANLTDQPVVARVRFDNPAPGSKPEVWDVTLLDKGTEVFFNLSGNFQDGERFFRPEEKDVKERIGPTAVMVMMVTSGKALLSAEGPFDKKQEWVPPPEGKVVLWTSRKGFFDPPPTPMDLHLGPWTDPSPEMPKGEEGKKRLAVMKALRDLNGDLAVGSLDAVLLKALNPGNDVALRRLAVRSAAAVDDLQRVIEALKDKDREVRWAAIETLWLWLPTDRDNDYRLFDLLNEVYDKSKLEPERIMDLLHGFSQQLLKDPNTYEGLLYDLKHKKLALRELANWRLNFYLPQIGAMINYNATDNEPMIQRAVEQWRDKLKEAGLMPAK
jgi:hypothetical protein